jgi:hypothetical protein
LCGSHYSLRLRGYFLRQWSVFTVAGMYDRMNLSIAALRSAVTFPRVTLNARVK